MPSSALSPSSSAARSPAPPDDKTVRTDETGAVHTHEDDDRRLSSRAQRSAPGRRVAALLAVLLAGWVIAANVVSNGPAPDRGVQVDPIGPAVLREATEGTWVPFARISGEARDGFPEPMVRRSDGICVGFGRVDFAPEVRRPSLARCEPAASTIPLADDEIRAIVAVQSGFDTWHVLEAGDDVTGLRVVTADGAEVDGARLFVSGSTLAIRLENDRPLVLFEWSTPGGTHRCVPEATAWRSATFCT